MKGIFAVSKNTLGILDLDEPQLGDYDALVEVEACGICNSTDWKIIEGRFKRGQFPILLGHESTGAVIKVGGKVRTYKVGDRVLRPRLYDKDVSVRGGSSRFGGFAQKAVVTDVWAQEGLEYDSYPHPQQKVPGHIRPEYAAAMIVLKENLDYIRKTDIHPGHSLAIVGTGPAGQSMAMWAKFLGVSPVVVFGRRDKWAGLFERLGADAYVAGSAVPAEGRIHLYGMPADDESYEEAFESDPRVYRSKVLEGAVHDELLQYVEDGRIDLSNWLSHVFPMDQYQRAFDIVKNEKPTKVVIRMNTGET
jgi:D-arabinose 1-dehydrogenase-like Zn-dependent alcohol dehydrogenase